MPAKPKYKNMLGAAAKLAFMGLTNDEIGWQLGVLDITPLLEDIERGRSRISLARIAGFDPVDIQFRRVMQATAPPGFLAYLREKDASQA